MKKLTKHTFSSIRSYLTDGDYRLLHRSPYFDSRYYLRLYPDVAESGIDPILHYLRDGYKEFRQPGELFDVQYYHKTLPELVDQDKNPLLHFLRTGYRQGLCPHPFFDPVFYEEQYGIRDSLQKPALQHYLHHGVASGCYPNRQVYSLSAKPVLSLLVPVYNVRSEHLEKCIQSVYYQSYPHWQLCLADDCSTSREAHPILRKWADRDPRISVVFLPENIGISGATNAAAESATGDFLVFLDNDDELAVDSLFLLTREINESGADLYYSDEDLIDEEGKRLSVFYKPAYNPQLLLCHNYITHLVAVTRRLFEKAGGFHPDKDGAQDYDLFLRLTEHTDQIVHIPEILYHWRASPTSTSINHSEKSYADEAGRMALAESLERGNLEGDVSFTDWKFFYRVRKYLPSSPLVSVVLSFVDEGVATASLCDVISKTTYQNCEYVVLVHSEKTSAVIAEELAREHRNTQVVFVHNTETYAVSLNRAVAEARGEFVVFLATEMRIQNSDWIEGLLEHCFENHVAAVGGHVEREEEIQSFTVPDIANDLPGYHASFLLQCSKHMNGLQCAQNVWALPRELLMVRRSIFLDCGGFDARYVDTPYADIDLSFRMAEQGKTFIYTPFARAELPLLKEGQSRTAGSVEGEARMLLQNMWHEKLMQGDPFYNLGILRKNDISLNAFYKWFSG